MTGSGKMCTFRLKKPIEGSLIIIDPKGDLTNLLLHFPDLAPQDFQTWIDADLARRAGKSIEQVATDAATSWREGLKEWGIPQEKILALKNAAQFAVFTPGSDAGTPVSVLSSLAAPEISWNDNREVLREKIISTVTALLGLVGYTEIDPLRSREISCFRIFSRMNGARERMLSWPSWFCKSKHRHSRDLARSR
jgi:hypothetical protein